MNELGEISKVVDRLELFMYVYNYLKERPKSSYPEIAAHLDDHFGIDVAPHKLASAIELLEKELGPSRLVIRSARSKANSLSSLADELHERVEGLLHDLRHWADRDHVIKIGVPDMLMNFVIPSVVAAFRKGRGKEAQGVEIEVSECRESEDIVAKVASGKLSFALTWVYEDKLGRLRKLCEPRSLFVEKLFDAEGAGFADRSELGFDMLMICSPTHPFVAKAKAAAQAGTPWRPFLKDLADQQIFVLPPRRQPLYQEIPLSPPRGGRFIEVDSFTHVIAHVRSRIKDSVGLVPSIYTEINEFRRKGQIFCAPITGIPRESAQVSIGCVSQGGISQLNPPARAFLRSSESILRRIGGLMEFEPSELQEIPETIEEYCDYRNCYFVMQNERIFGVPGWYKGVLSWDLPQTDPLLDAHHYEGRLRGHLAGTFTTRTSREWVFGVNGWLRAGDKAKNDRLFQFVGEGLAPQQKNTIICTFNIRIQYKGHNALVGVWSGRDDEGLATVAPMVLSQKPFGDDISILRSMINKASYRFLPNAEDWGIINPRAE